MLGLTIEARMGRKRVVVATLLAHSVKAATRRHMMKAMAGGGMLSRGVSWAPNHVDRPDSCKTAKRDARWKREEPYHFSCPFSPPFSEQLSCKLQKNTARAHRQDCSVSYTKKPPIISHLRNWKVGDPPFIVHY